jgi:two-component system response regulator AtoC
VDHFCRKFEARLGLNNLTVQEEVITVLQNYAWPGNVRELENALERAFVLSEGPNIGISDLDERFFEQENTSPNRLNSSNEQSSTSDEQSDLSLKPLMADYEKSLIKKALERTNGNRSRAANLLGISNRSLLYKLKDYGLS